MEHPAGSRFKFEEEDFDLAVKSGRRYSSNVNSMIEALMKRDIGFAVERALAEIRGGFRLKRKIVREMIDQLRAADPIEQTRDRIDILHAYLDGRGHKNIKQKPEPKHNRRRNGRESIRSLPPTSLAYPITNAW